MLVEIVKSKKPNKKFDAVIDKTKTVSFGAKGYSDFTIHKDEDRKDRYIKRHKTSENWNDPTTAGFYAKHVLWKKPTMKESIADLNKKFSKLKVSVKSD